MNSFEITAVNRAADATYPEGSETPVLAWWTEIRVRIPRGFDWEANGAKLLKKLRQAAELNDE